MADRTRRPLGTTGYVEYPRDRSGDIRVGDRMLPPWVDLVMPGAGGQPQLTMRLEVRGGVPECREVRIASTETGREVKTLDMRAVNVAEIVTEVYGMLAYRIISEGDGVMTVAEHAADSEQAAAVRHIEAARKGKGARRITPEFLAEVAEVYRDNISGNPTQAVSRRYGVGASMAAEYIRRARQAGLLPPTTPGKKRA